MRRTLVLAAAAALTLAAVPAAAAKEITKAQVCGPDACRTIHDEEEGRALTGGGAERRPPRAAPYYEVRVTMAEGDEEHTWSIVVVPARKAIRGTDGTWVSMLPDTLPALETFTAGLKPFPASELTGAAVAAEPASTPAASDEDSMLWPEGVILALIALAAAVGVVRLSGRWRPASG